MNFIRSIYLAIVLLLSNTFGTGAEIGVTSFLIPSILMGIGVAIDVLIATVVKFNDSSLSWKNWTLPVTITHTLFPAVGYFLFWFTSESFPAIKIILGVTGFVLVLLFIYEVICESINTEPVFGISDWIGKKIGFSKGAAGVFVAVLAVSWDALWSGPAKAAQATAGNWTGLEVALSFLIAGLVVAIVAELALVSSSLLKKYKFHNIESLTRFNLVGKYFELTVIGGFGFLSLWNAFSDTADLYISIAISGSILLITFLILSPSLHKNELIEAKEAIK